MRNTELVPIVMQLAREAAGVTGVQTLAEAGETKYPIGFVVLTEHRESRWQAIQGLADGETHENPAADIEGEAAPYEETTILSGDQWLAAVIGRAKIPVIREITCWSRGGKQAEGVTVHFHNGARSFFRRL